MECEPSLNELVVMLATPLKFNVAVPSTTVPSLNVTAPVAVPVEPVDASVTVADSVTVVPNLAGFADALRVTFVLARLITSLRGVDELPVKLPSPA